MYDVLCWQLAGGLDGIPAKDVENMIIAYEPVWAIGTGVDRHTSDSATKAYTKLSETGSRKSIQNLSPKRCVFNTSSVKPDSVDRLMQCPDIRRLPVGGASLSSDDFMLSICSFHQGETRHAPRVVR